MTRQITLVITRFLRANWWKAALYVSLIIYRSVVSVWLLPRLVKQFIVFQSRPSNSSTSGGHRSGVIGLVLVSFAVVTAIISHLKSVLTHVNFIPYLRKELYTEFSRRTNRLSNNEESVDLIHSLGDLPRKISSDVIWWIDGGIPALTVFLVTGIYFQSVHWSLLVLYGISVGMVIWIGGLFRQRSAVYHSRLRRFNRSHWVAIYAAVGKLHDGLPNYPENRLVHPLANLIRTQQTVNHLRYYRLQLIRCLLAYGLILMSFIANYRLARFLKNRRHSLDVGLVLSISTNQCIWLLGLVKDFQKLRNLPNAIRRYNNKLTSNPA